MDLAYENRRKGGRELYDQAVKSMQNTGVGLKYPTATIEESPNAVLRKLLHFSVIHRPISSIPGIKTNFTGKLDLEIIRIATGGNLRRPGPDDWRLRSRQPPGGGPENLRTGGTLRFFRRHARAQIVDFGPASTPSSELRTACLKISSMKLRANFSLRAR